MEQTPICLFLLLQRWLATVSASNKNRVDAVLCHLKSWLICALVAGSSPHSAKTVDGNHLIL